MSRLKTSELIEAADVLANDLLTFAKDQGIGAHDLLMVTAIAERLLQRAVARSPQAALLAMQEADATLAAVSSHQEPN